MNLFSYQILSKALLSLLRAFTLLSHISFSLQGVIHFGQRNPFSIDYCAISKWHLQYAKINQKNYWKELFWQCEKRGKRMQ